MSHSDVSSIMKELAKSVAPGSGDALGCVGGGRGGSGGGVVMTVTVTPMSINSSLAAKKKSGRSTTANHVTVARRHQGVRGKWRLERKHEIARDTRALTTCSAEVVIAVVVVNSVDLRQGMEGGG